jgi:bacterioferritin
VFYTRGVRDLAPVVQAGGPEGFMANQKEQKAQTGREGLVQGLNEDLAREYQAIIAYVVYSQMLKGAAYMAIAKELEKHAGEELAHALTIAKHIDYLGGTPVVTPKPVVVTDDAKKMLEADLNNESETIRHYRRRLKECEAIAEYVIAEDIREILRQEQEHLIDLATALGIDAPEIPA